MASTKTFASLSRDKHGWLPRALPSLSWDKRGWLPPRALPSLSQDTHGWLPRALPSLLRDKHGWLPPRALPSLSRDKHGWLPRAPPSLSRDKPSNIRTFLRVEDAEPVEHDAPLVICKRHERARQVAELDNATQTIAKTPLRPVSIIEKD